MYAIYPVDVREYLVLTDFQILNSDPLQRSEDMIATIWLFLAHPEVLRANKSGEPMSF